MNMNEGSLVIAHVTWRTVSPIQSPAVVSAVGIIINIQCDDLIMFHGVVVVCVFCNGKYDVYTRQ